METFMNKDFLLSTPTARTLYHDHAAEMPIVDYHCHISPREIAEDRRFGNLAEVWLGGDHYKWRVMRAMGVEEGRVTGGAADKEKFLAYAAMLPRAVGNPLYHWTHLELQRYFDCSSPLNAASAERIWEHCNRKLQEDGMSVRGIIRRSNVTHLNTTDDPIDSLEWHKQLFDDPTWDVKVYPGWRPDKATHPERDGFLTYIGQLGEAAGVTIRDYGSLLEALTKRLDLFAGMGCRSCDHGMDYIPLQSNADETAPAAFAKALRGETLTTAETECYKLAVLRFLGAQYAKRGWVMQIHYGAHRNVNTAMFRALGADTGYDAASTRETSLGLIRFLDSLAVEDKLPKVILFSLNPSDDAMLTSVAGGFQKAGVVGRVQQGAAWWFNDTKSGMIAQMTQFAATGVLGSFVGMLTDSRSFTSYPRHEYFRRILCDMLGGWVENGEVYADLDGLGELVRDISYHNAVRFFGLG
jgi:glucuronate isomerase